MKKVHTSCSVREMNLKKERSHSRFTSATPTLQISITFRLMCEFNFSPCPIAYFICKVYERGLIAFGVGIANSCYWQGLILAHSNAVQYENEIGNPVY